jgi:DNA mismatch repair protein MutS
MPRTVIERAREILFNLEKKELDESGLPKIGYRQRRNWDKSQLLLFKEDREAEVLREIRDKLENCDLSSLTVRQALSILQTIKEKLKALS